MNAIELLKDDHKSLRKLFAELGQTTKRASKTRTDLLARIAKQIEVHSQIEEEIFYPAFKEAAGEGDGEAMYFEALEEHRAAGELVLPDLLATDVSSDRFSGRAKVLREMFEHHAGEEEDAMFPKARELLGNERLRELGAEMQVRKAGLMAQPSTRRQSSDTHTLSSELIGAVVSAISPERKGDANALSLDGTHDELPPPSMRNPAGKGKDGSSTRRSR